MNMENNTLLSHELEDMRSQIGILKEKLEKQTIVNEQHIRRSMKSKMSDLTRIVAITIFAGVFALVYSTWFFWSQSLSPAFIVATAVMLVICIALTILQRVRLKSMDFSQSNLVEAARTLAKIRKHYSDWHWIAIPMLVVWFGWLIYEIISRLGTETYVIGFCCGALTGGLIGGFIGFRINRKMVRKMSEILTEIEDLQQEN